MKLFRQIYKLSFYIITLITFVFGGIIQYFLGISNTVITFLLMVLLYYNYFLYALLKKRVVFNAVTFWSICYFLIIILSAIINQSELILTSVYFIFPALPLGVYLFSFINYKEKIIPINYIYKLFYYISILQLPMLLIQRNLYDSLIQFNNSGQVIDWYDFMFGTFFIKSDHSLAIFVLFSIILILTKNKDKLFKYPIISIIYLSITVFLAESTISKLFLCFILSASIIIPFYDKYKTYITFKIVTVLLATIMVLIAYNLREQEFVKRRLGGQFERQYSIEVSERRYESKTAKRGQILIVLFNKIPVKGIGDGPYSYFNILTGKFTNTKHFTQIIWTYFDLGLTGIIVFFGLLISLISYLDIQRGILFFIFLSAFVVYSFYTTIYSDIAILFSLIMIFNKKKNEYNSRTIS